MDRAYARLDVKSVTTETKVVRIKGIASTPTTDRMGDIVEPLGARFKTPMPLLLHHDSTLPVGNVTFARATSSGIPFEAELPIVTEPGVVQDRVNEAIHSLKYLLIGACSIGFKAAADGVERLKSGGLRFKEWDWLELSLVPIPAQPEAVITGIKSFDNELRAALGRKQIASPSPGASGSAVTAIPPTRSPKGNPMNLQEMIDARSGKVARSEELLTLKQANGSFTAEERSEFDAIGVEIDNLNDEIKVKSYHETNIATAQPVSQMTQRSATGGRGMSFVRKSDPEDKFKGQAYTRMVIAKAFAALNHVSPSAVAEHRWGKTNPQLVAWIKANEVAGGGTGSGEWGAELVSMDGRYTGDFIEFLYGATAFDQLGFREVPANVTIKGQDGESTAYWVGESKGIPVTTGDFSTVNLTPLKVAAMAVVSNDLIRYSSPAAEGLVANSLRQASAKRIDQTVFSTTAASAGVSPAGLMNSLAAIATTGTDEAAVRAMISALYAPFITAKNALGLTFVMGPAQAKAISMLVNSLGQTSFPFITGSGGSLLGDKVVVGDNIDSSQVILLKESDIYKIGDSGVEVSISREATIEQRSDPTGATDTPVAMTTTGLTSMFQEDSSAIRVVRHINFAKRRSTAVSWTDTADFQGVAS